MLRCIAIDDEELALELLEDNIRKVPYLQLVAAFNSPLEAMKLLQEEQIDLVFLDIQMPGITGIQFIKSFPAQCMFILITAYEKYALEGYNLNVIDYLVKPVEFDRFLKACNKASDLHQLKLKSKSGGDQTVSDYFFVHVEYSLVKIQKSDILYIEGLKDYIKIYLKAPARPVVTRMSMRTIEDQLPPAQFSRIHKSYIVAIAAIDSIRKTSVFIGSAELPISDNYKEDFFQLIGKL
ncbi:MAG: response regulator transcription factor [Chitinophagaceae bacterium]|nr:MAG: response regulator transcription factor [Chitinophagaceae bacterium]